MYLSRVISLWMLLCAYLRIPSGSVLTLIFPQSHFCPISEDILYVAQWASTWNDWAATHQVLSMHHRRWSKRCQLFHCSIQEWVADEAGIKPSYDGLIPIVIRWLMAYTTQVIQGELGVHFGHMLQIIFCRRVNTVNMKLTSLLFLVDIWCNYLIN